jgi:hypothetical protein
MKINHGNKISHKLSRNKQIQNIVIVVMITTITITTGFIIANTKSISNVYGEVPIDNIKCEAMEPGFFHIHSHLSIFINGKNYTLPPLIGITENCLYWLHTHDDSGVIHIESPETRNFTLGNLFDIWNKKFNNNQIFDNIANEGNKLNVYVNGTKVPSESNFRDIVFHSHDVIAIIYGKPPVAIPSKYDFGLL